MSLTHERPRMMAAHASRNARLGDMERRGYLAVLTDGYRRCEGAFFCPLGERERIAKLMIAGQPVLFRGTLYEDGHTRLVERNVLISGFAAEGGQVRVRLIAQGPA